MTRPQPTAEDMAAVEAAVQEAVAAAQAAAAEAVRNGQEAGANAREQAQAAREQAQAAREQTGAPDNQNQYNIRFGAEGLVIESIDADGNTLQQPFDPSNLIPPQVTDILLITVLGVIGMILAFPIGRAIARYIDRRGLTAPVGNDVGQRLVAIEQAVDAVAIEMERLSESNRFTTKLLTEHVAAPDFAASPQRVGDTVPVAPRR